MPRAFLNPVTLAAKHVRLVPLETAHCAALQEAVEDGQMYRLWYTAIPAPGDMLAEIERRLALREEGRWLPFAVLDPATNQAVGMTNFLNVDAVHRRVEIGGTWYAARFQRTALNTEAKWLLLRHAFEDLDCIAVEFRTHVLNLRSRRAIERVGAKLDGILRAHMRLPDGTLRDTCVYSVTAAEWPAVKAYLQWQRTRRLLE